MPIFVPKRLTLQQKLEAEKQRIANITESAIKQEAVFTPPPTSPPPLYIDAVSDYPQRREPVVSYVPPPPVLSSVATAETPQITEATVEEPDKVVEWYEQPKRLAEQAMGAIGEGISKVPVLPDILEWAAPAFEFIHEKLEKPFAAIITSPFSPNLPWRQGESWLEHEKREYNMWKAPTYVKGVAEFAMPLWWLPYLGWAARGAKALGITNKMSRALSALPRVGKPSLPTGEILNDTLFKQDFFKRVSLWAEDKPVLSGIVRAIGGPAAFVSGVAQDPLAITKRALVKMGVIKEMRHGIRGLLVPKLQRLGDAKKILQISDEGLVGAVTPKAGNNLGVGLSEVFENPTMYKFATKEARQFVEETRKVLREIYELAAKEGVKVPKELVFHRLVEGKAKVLEGGLKGQFEASDWGSLFEAGRHYKTMAEGIQAGVKYGNDPIKTVNATIDHYIRKIATKRFDDEVGKLGKTPMEKFATQFPNEAERISTLMAQINAGKHALQAIKRIKSFRGASIPGATLAKIRNVFPDVAAKLDGVFAFAPQQVDDIISAMGRDVFRATRIKPQDFKVLLAQYNKTPGRILASEIDSAIRQLNITSGAATKTIEKIYKLAYRNNRQRINDAINAIDGDMERVLSGATAELKPLRKMRSDFTRPYREGRPLGEFEAAVYRHPAFRGKFFDKDVARTIDQALGASGQDFLRKLGAVSGSSRMLTAAMDFSAPFIQGLAVLGRDPIAWIKGVAKQFEFFVAPKRLYQYMTSPDVMAIATERVSYGGARSAFEFFDMLQAVEKGLGKVPAVGKGLRKVAEQTYGRAEAAFTGFGEVARNEMWKALRRPGMAEAELRELARSIDRMTGVMSTEALALGRTQQEFEQAFMFFAPRYTRASLSFVADMFKGGMTGANARKSLGSLMAAGMATYYGTCKALGQQPYLDPRSSKFMTIKVGDSRVGIGGILYGLMRMGANVIATAREEPIDLVRLSRSDNPFIKFMYQRTAPLTGLIMGVAIERKNYFGEPFESPADWGRFLAGKVLPIAVQSQVLEDQSHPLVFAAEFLGGRTFPKSTWELRDETRERLAQEQFGVSYENLSKLDKRRIDKSPDVTIYQEELDTATVHRGDALDIAFMQRRREFEDARLMYEQDVWQAQRAVDAGVISTYEFRERLQDANYGLGATYEHINSNPQYAEVLEKMAEPRDMSKEYIGDVAYDEMMGLLYSKPLEDEFGAFQYDRYNEIRDNIRKKYGENVWQYILEREAQKREDLPPLAIEYFRARDILKPYWQVKDWALKHYGVPQTEWQKRRLEEMIQKIRKRLRANNPDIEKYYQMFYVRPQ